MKIAVTSQNFRTVTGHAGRARRFLIYDVEPGAPSVAEPVEVGRLDLPKELAMHDFHAQGAHPLDGVDVILTQGFGEGFARRMDGRSIVAMTTDKSAPVDAVKDYVTRLPTRDGTASGAPCGCGHGHQHQHQHQHGHGQKHHE